MSKQEQKQIDSHAHHGAALSLSNIVITSYYTNLIHENIQRHGIISIKLLSPPI